GEHRGGDVTHEKSRAEVRQQPSPEQPGLEVSAAASARFLLRQVFARQIRERPVWRRGDPLPEFPSAFLEGYEHVLLGQPRRREAALALAVDGQIVAECGMADSAAGSIARRPRPLNHLPWFLSQRRHQPISLSRSVSLASVIAVSKKRRRPSR